LDFLTPLLHFSGSDTLEFNLKHEHADWFSVGLHVILQDYDRKGKTKIQNTKAKI